VEATPISVHALVKSQKSVNLEIVEPTTLTIQKVCPHLDFIYLSGSIESAVSHD
jgi:hypothetical protein